MELFLGFVLIILLVLYLREHNKLKKAEADYQYINSRICDMINHDENNYILVPSDNVTVKETVININNLLEKFYDRQVDYNRSQKTLLQIFTNISHDLRTPITVLKGYIEMLYLQSQKEQISPTLKITIDKMQSNSNELVHSVNNLFNMAKLQSGDIMINIQKINLTQLCNEMILEFYDLLEKRDFRVEINIVDKPIYADVDTEAMKRILKNLIDNAIIHGSSGKFLKLSLYKEENYIYIEVEDHGEGISEEEKSLIFTRTYTGNRHKGNGLGLAISQGLAKSMGGSISVYSTPHEKTVFTIKLQS